MKKRATKKRAVKKSKSALPVSTATNAYDLLTEIEQLTLAEPKRMRMPNWGGVVGNAASFDSAPACNTVGCIGGWSELLTGHRKSAREILGLTDVQVYKLFFGALSHDYLGAGTPQHARKVVARIRKFKRDHKVQLRAKAI